MKAIILAAGEGSRLRPLTNDRPKCMVEVGGRPLLAYQLDVLRASGIRDISLVKGYLADSLNPPGVKTYINVDYATTNMIWTLFCAREELQGDIIVSYGDIAYSRHVLNALLDAPHDISVVVDKSWLPYWQDRFENPLSDAESLKMDTHGRLLEIGQKPLAIEDIHAQYIGLMKFTREGLKILTDEFSTSVERRDILGKHPRKAYMTDLLQMLINHGHSLCAIPVHGEWIEVDSRRDIDVALSSDRMVAIKNNATIGEKSLASRIK